MQVDLYKDAQQYGTRYLKTSSSTYTVSCYDSEISDTSDITPTIRVMDNINNHSKEVLLDTCSAVDIMSK